MSKLDAKQMRQEAEDELREERARAAKAKMKELLKKKQAAQVVVDNIDREIALCEADINEGKI